MAFRTPFTELLGIEHPVVLAPMGGSATGITRRLAAEAAAALARVNALSQPGSR